MAVTGGARRGGGKREGRKKGRKNAAVTVSLGKEKEGGHKGETSVMAAT